MTPYNMLSDYQNKHFSLGDTRLNTRIEESLEKIFNRGSSLSFPNIFPECKELKGFYRLMNNAKVTAEKIQQGANDGLRAYYESEDCTDKDTLVFNYSDTTYGSYKNRQLDLGYIEIPTDNGFVLHTGILTNTSYVPIAISHQEFIFRARNDYGKRKDRQKKTFEEKESFKWTKAIDWSKEFTLSTGITVVNVMDREADIGGLFNYAFEQEEFLLVRSSSDRVIQKKAKSEKGEKKKLRGYLKQQPVNFTTIRELIDSKGKKHQVTCEVRHQKVNLKGINKPLLAIHLLALNPPEGLEETEWILFSNTEDIEVLTLIDAYTKRWRTNEDYHKCLKTGCKIQERQFRNQASLINTIALLSLVSIRLLRMRHMGEQQPNVSVNSVLDSQEIKVAQSLAKQYLQPMDLKHCKTNTVLWWVLLLGRMGGHQGYKRKGLPGWQTLYKGWTFFQTICKGVNLSKNILNSS